MRLYALLCVIAWWQGVLALDARGLLDDVLGHTDAPPSANSLLVHHNPPVMFTQTVSREPQPHHTVNNNPPDVPVATPVDGNSADPSSTKTLAFQTQAYIPPPATVPTGAASVPSVGLPASPIMTTHGDQKLSHRTTTAPQETTTAKPRSPNTTTANPKSHANVGGSSSSSNVSDTTQQQQDDGNTGNDGTIGSPIIAIIIALSTISLLTLAGLGALCYRRRRRSSKLNDAKLSRCGTTFGASQSANGDMYPSNRSEAPSPMMSNASYQHQQHHVPDASYHGAAPYGNYYYPYPDERQANGYYYPNMPYPGAMETASGPMPHDPYYVEADPNNPAMLAPTSSPPLASAVMPAHHLTGPPAPHDKQEAPIIYSPPHLYE